MDFLNLKEKGSFKMKNGNFKRYLLIVTMATSLTGCFRMGSLSTGAASNGSTSVQGIPVGSEGPAAAVMEGSQTMKSFSAMTGVTASSATTSAFTNYASNLPVGGNPAQVSQPTLQAFANIAAGFCDDATTQNPGTLYPGISFSGAPSQFTGATLTNVENAMCQNFLHETPCSAPEATILNSAAASCVSNVPAIGSQANGKTVTTAIQTEAAADCICTIVLASASALAH